MVNSGDKNERDLVLPPNAYAYIQDKANGDIVVYVGPWKESLGDTDQPVRFDLQSKRFLPCPLEQAVIKLTIAPEGYYIILKNPALQGEGENRAFRHPDTAGKSNSRQAKLTVGRKVNIKGPSSFPLWPGQITQVIKGHHLRSNQYLLGRVYDEEAARDNMEDAVLVGEGKEKSLIPTGNNLTTGKLFIIKGTDASFFIPPTGIEVVTGEDGEFVRDAETLEVLEYCILLDEDGEKKFCYGPDVVFPEPTETFITKFNKDTKQHARKFTAFELNENTGLYIKVIKEYKDPGCPEADDDGNVSRGTELFITGKTDPVYFPRDEHAIIKYGNNKKIQYSVAVPKGEARYVMNRLTGGITLKEGPCMFLADPRTEVMVKRVLDQKEVGLLYPDNKEALDYNAGLETLLEGDARYITANVAVAAAGTIDSDQLAVFGSSLASGPQTRSQRKKAMKDFAGDEFWRNTKYTPPRTVTLDTKYDGAVTVSPFTGYAVNVVNKTGQRRVVEGPSTVMLEYDEMLEPISFSKGVPKNTAKRKKAVYLKVLNNRVTDRISVQTKDLVDVDIYLAYRINFEGDRDLWFNVDDYVALLTDHMRSLLRNEIQKYGVEAFWDNKIDIIRDCILGKQSEGAARSGRLFEQNGMRIYDVDFKEALIKDKSISALLVDAQHDSIRQRLDLERGRRDLEVYVEKQGVTQKRQAAEDETAEQSAALKLVGIQRDQDVRLEKVMADVRVREQELAGETNKQEALDSILGSELSRRKSAEELNDALAQASLKLRLDELEAQTKAEVDRIGAVSEDLIAAMQSLGHSELTAKLTENMSAMALLGGKSVAEVAQRVLAGTGLEPLIDKLPIAAAPRANRSDNGA